MRKMENIVVQSLEAKNTIISLVSFHGINWNNRTVHLPGEVDVSHRYCCTWAAAMRLRTASLINSIKSLVIKLTTIFRMFSLTIIYVSGNNGMQGWVVAQGNNNYIFGVSRDPYIKAWKMERKYIGGMCSAHILGNGHSYWLNTCGNRLPIPFTFCFIHIFLMCMCVRNIIYWPNIGSIRFVSVTTIVSPV